MFKLKFSPLLIIAISLLSSPLFAQPPQKVGTATVAGRVTLKGEPVTGVTVELSPQSQTSMSDRSKNVRAQTDSDGRFRLTGVTGGQYLINALAPGFATPSDTPFGRQGKTLNVADGENVENVELAIKRGAVIAGRITDASDNPIIETNVRLAQVDERGRSSQTPPIGNSEMYRTDDRGLFRIWGLPAGKYKVSVGYSQTQGGVYFQTSRTFYPQTFYPGTTDESQAKIIDLAEGAESTSIDIKVGESKRAYDVAGRVVDAESGKPVAGVEIGYGVFTQGSGGSWGSGVGSSDANGEFVLQNVLPGKYAAFISTVRVNNSEFYSDLSPFEISDSDVAGIEIKAQRGGTISGTAVIEGATDPAVASKLSQFNIIASSRLGGSSAPVNRSTTVGADGSFRLNGMRPGKINLSFSPRPPGFTLRRIESKGAAITDGLELQAGEQLSDVRLVFAYGTATVRGQVNLVGGTLPEGVGLYVSARMTGTNPTGGNASPVDARGQFIVKDLVAGEYELRVMIRYYSTPSAEFSKLFSQINKVRQTVSVSNSGETQATITVDLSQKENEQ